MRSTRTLAGLVLVGCLFVSGCGPLSSSKATLGATSARATSATSATKSAAPLKATAADKAIDAASAKVDAAGSAKVDGTIVTKGLGATLTVPFAGKERWSPTEAASLVISGLQVAGVDVGRTSVLVADQTVYLKLPSLASVLHKQWAKISLKGATSFGGADLGQYAGQAQQLQPGQYLRLLSTSVNVKAVGTATIDGVATKHYSGSVDLQKALASLPLNSGVPQIWTKLATSEGIKAVHVNVWLDAGDRPRRITLALASSTVSLTVSLHLSSFGVTVSVTAPPKAETLDLTQGLLKTLS